MCSLDVFFSWRGFRALWVMEVFRGRLGLVGRWIGGRVEERPGGERDRMDGSS